MGHAFCNGAESDEKGVKVGRIIAVKEERGLVVFCFDYE